jgi:hypothetical protein
MLASSLILGNAVRLQAQFVRFVHSPRQIPTQIVEGGRGGDGRLCSTKPVYK